MRQSVFFFLFLSLSCSKDGGKGNDDGRSTRPVRRTTAQYKKNFVDGVVFFFFFRCRGAATGVAGAVKVAPRGHAEGTSRPPFPKLPPEKIFFFATLQGYITTASQTASQTTSLSKRTKKKKRKLLFPAHNSLSQSGFRSAVFFPCFISLLSNCSLTFAADIS